MKKIIFTLLLALTTTFSQAQTHTGDLVLTNQAAIDTFNFNEITGNLIINRGSGSSLTNLDNLIGLTEIGGNLTIQFTDALSSLSGLGSLTEIGGNLTIQSNGALSSLSGLGSLTEIGGNLTIQSNGALSSLSGLGSLTEIGGNLSIQNNNSLASLSGLGSLTEIGGNLTIQNNNSLTSLSGLEMLESIGGTLIITRNRDLTDFCAVSSLIGDDKQITMGEYTVGTNGYNPPYRLIDDENYCSNADGGIFDGNLTLDTQASIDAFSYRRIIGNLTINESVANAITNLDGLRGLIEIQEFLSIGNNTSLSSLSGLELLASIGGALTITGNTALTDFCVLSSLIGDDKQITSGEYTVNMNGYNPPYTFIQNESLCSPSAGIFDGNLTVNNQDSIDDFRYRAITGNLIIDESVANAITNLDGLNELTNIGGNLTIQSNDSLVSLSGLELLASIGDTLTITGNTALTDFCAISSLIGDDKQITSTEYTVDTNGYNPPYTFIQNESLCSPSAGIFDGNLTVNTQDRIDDFRYRAITGDLIIDESVANAITNLDGLNELTNIGGNLTIQSNDSLVSLSGLELLASIGDTLTITGNTALTDFCVLSSLIGDDKQITSGEYRVNTNGYNPPYRLIDDENYCSNADGGIFVGNLTLDTQASIDAFSYRRIIGNLTINDALNGNITNLDSLRGLIEVRGFLSVGMNASLTSLSGLEDLIRLEGALYIGNNASLPSLSGLDALTAIGGFLIIEFNTSLMSVSGLASLTDIGEYFSIATNTSLVSLSGLEMLDSIGGALTITGNTALTDFCAISSLIGDDKQITSGEYTLNTNSYNPPHTFIQNESLCSPSAGIFIGNLTLNNQDSIDDFRYRAITGNLIIDEAIANAITNLDSLSELTNIGGNLTIQSNDSLVSLSGLELLASIGGTLTIIGNTALTDFCAISSLIGDDKQITSTEYFVTTNGYNPPYTLIDDENFCSNADERIYIGNLTLNNQDSIDAFRYRVITGNLAIDESVANAITNLDGLSELTNIGGGLRIQTNGSLVSLSGLEALKTVGGLFFIGSNPQLASLTAFTSLTRLGDRLFIDTNDVLVSLNGLERITTINSTLQISNNNSLVDFCTISSLVGDGNEITSGEYVVYNNYYNPIYDAIQTSRACLLPEVLLTSQAAIDAFTVTEIPRNLVIEEAIPGNIINLTGLSELTIIEGQLRIRNNTALTSLSGLESLTELEGRLIISGNPSLTDFCAISSLVGNDKEITSDLYRVNTNGYNPPYAYVQRETSCSNTDGGIFIGSLTLDTQASIEAFNYTTITGNLTIEEATPKTITNLNSLSSLTSVDGTVAIQMNTRLSSLSGLEMLDSIGGTLTIISNTDLIDFCAVSSLIGDDKQITEGEYTVTTNSYNPSYETIQTSTICSISEVILTSQAAINAFMGTEVMGNLVIEEATAGDITNLTGLSTLTTIGRQLRIRNNTALTSLSGLEMLDSIGGTLRITGNGALTDFCAISSLVGNENQITREEYSVNTNGYNLAYTFIQNETLCSPSAGIFDGDLTLTSQEAIDTFNYTAITGNLTINDALDNNITNVDSLGSLTKIGGYLNIQFNNSLLSLNGLDSLTEVGGYLNIQNTNLLLSLNGLESLTAIGGNLSLQGNTLESLNGLESLTAIRGNLSLQDNSLKSLNGLDSLTAIGGNLSIQNESLTSLSGLESLTAIGGDLSLQNNVLDSLNGLESLTAIGGNLSIQNTSLRSVNGLDSLTEVGGNLSIGNNRILTSLNSLASVTEIGGNLRIFNNSSLTSLSGLDSLTAIGGDLIIGFNGNLRSLNSLASVTEIGGDLRIFNNSSLRSFSGLEMLESIGGELIIENNSGLSLNSFCLLSSLVGDDKQMSRGEYSVSGNSTNPTYRLIQLADYCNGNTFFGDLTLANQEAIDTFSYRVISGNLDILETIGGNIMNLDSLESLIAIGGNLGISSNPSLMSLSGLDSLTEIGGYLDINNNSSLMSLSGLGSLTEIGGYLDINNNSSLMSLSGLEMLDSIGGSLTLTSNPALTDFCAISSLIGDDKQINSGEYTVTTNGYNPPYTFVGNENLCSNADGGIFEGNLRLNSQDSIDAFNYSRVTGHLTINDSLDGNITSLSGLSELIQVGGVLQIDSNSSLTSLNGLESLTEIGGYLTINDNDSLGSLNGLESLHSTGDTLIVTGNRDLTDFCTISPLIGIVNQITTIAYIVSGNDYNPLYTEIQTTTRCSLDPPAVVADLPDVFIQPGAAFDPINLGPSFSDPNGYALTYTATSSDETAVTVSINESTLTLTEVNGEGTATITVTATNDSVLSVSAAFTVFITPNLPPTVANSLIDVEIASGTAFAPIDLSAVFSDPDGDVLTYTVATSDVAIVTATLNGTALTLTETGKGTATITVTATDAFRSVDDTFEVTITNTAPVVVPNQLVTVFTQPGTPFAPIDLSAAFTDANGDELTYTAASSDETVVTVSVSGITLTLTEVNGEGTATITVTATDGEAFVSATFTVFITLNMPPTVENLLTDIEIVSGTAFETIDISGVFSDPDGEALTYTVATSDTAIVTATLNGTTLTLTETGKGTATITVTATDAFGLPFDDTFEVTITNTAPEIVANQLLTAFTQPGTPFAPIDLSAAFRDANGDELTYTATSSDENVVTVSVSGTTLTLTEVGGVGTATITVTATDGEASINGTFMAIISDNNAPIRTPLAFPPIPAVMVGYQLTPPVDLTPFFSDPDGDALTYTATTGDASIATVEIVQTSRMTFTAIGVGTTTLTVTATDPEGFFASESVTITVEGALGIAETDILVVYPNPSSGVFELSRTVDVVSVYDMSGRLVYRGRNTKELDLTSQPSGQYLVEVGVGKEKGRYTVIKQ